MRATFTLERNHANLILHIELKHIAAIVKSPISVRRPDNAFRPDEILKFCARNSEIVVLLLVRIYGGQKRIGNFPCRRFRPKRDVVGTPLGKTLFYLVVRTG